MKQLSAIVIIILITSSITCRGTENGRLTNEKNKITLDIMSCITAGTIRLGFGHRLDSRWSIEGKVGIRLSPVGKTDTETMTHWKDVGRDYLESSADSFRRQLMRTGINIQYWPLNTYKGVFIKLGAEIYDRGHPDGIIGFGYVCRIWKSLHSDISFQTGLIRAVQNQKISPEGLEVSISYIF